MMNLLLLNNIEMKALVFISRSHYSSLIIFIDVFRSPFNQCFLYSMKNEANIGFEHFIFHFRLPGSRNIVSSYASRRILDLRVFL